MRVGSSMFIYSSVFFSLASITYENIILNLIFTKLICAYCSIFHDISSYLAKLRSQRAQTRRLARALLAVDKDGGCPRCSRRTRTVAAPCRSRRTRRSAAARSLLVNKEFVRAAPRRSRRTRSAAKLLVGRERGPVDVLVRCEQREAAELLIPRPPPGQRPPLPGAKTGQTPCPPRAAQGGRRLRQMGILVRRKRALRPLLARGE